ncbi:Capsular polysaccharide synthesis enzyme Cap8C [Lunatimonas lonarensis]|uniref:protein-tyrosine-phosphatase n=1 Tax=Lunatimonas lonarensis TaxID=1232681 RepID=R7ZYJ1_9BACT|nr:CpsB/CapC family capsule biosynthesis tyrosine phosphatase [Lunatimonas lonarensis]EON79129.1 Capsular polysaccharide synthesis enzyme Cap8C [Lunatimonas lonarensis]
MSILSLFKKKKTKEDLHLDLSWMKVDMHSHLIPGIDDGAQTMEDAIGLVRRLSDLGLEKLIVTPHIMSEFYKNTPEIIGEGLEMLKKEISKAGIPIQVEAAAEYYLDELFYDKILKKDPLLTFGNNMVLVETGFMNKTHILEDALFRLETAGYKPVYAHPERYLYLHQNQALLDSLADRNIFFQLNLLSLTGYYSKPVKKFAEKLIDMGLVRLVGTDCHNQRYLDALERLPSEKYYEKLISLPLVNSSL